MLQIKISSPTFKVRDVNGGREGCVVWHHVYFIDKREEHLERDDCPAFTNHEHLLCVRRSRKISGHTQSS